MLSNCGAGEYSWESLGQQGDQTSQVNPKGNQSWIFTGRTDAEAEALSDTLATSCKKLTLQKRLWCWERLKAGREEGDRGWNG